QRLVVTLDRDGSGPKAFRELLNFIWHARAQELLCFGFAGPGAFDGEHDSTASGCQKGNRAADVEGALHVSITYVWFSVKNPDARFATGGRASGAASFAAKTTGPSFDETTSSNSRAARSRLYRSRCIPKCPRSESCQECRSYKCNRTGRGRRS